MVHRDAQDSAPLNIHWRPGPHACGQRSVVVHSEAIRHRAAGGVLAAGARHNLARPGDGSLCAGRCHRRGAGGLQSLANGTRSAGAPDPLERSSVFPAQDVSLRLSNVSIDATSKGCQSASGDVRTDALSTISAVYGANWPELDGSLSCVDGELVVSVEGRAADGTRIAAKSSLQGNGRLELWDVPDSQTNALLLAGFTNEAGRFVYMQRVSNGESVQ